MPENRYFVDFDLQQGETYALPKEELSHLRVMRKQSGDSIELVNGHNILAKATLETANTVTVQEIITTQNPPHQIILALGLLRPKNLDWVVEKGTELGVTAFWLFPAEKGEKNDLSKNQKIRLRNLTISAMKQCGRLDLPPIELKEPLSKWSPPFLPLFFGDLEATAPLTPCESALIAIGPESGFSPQEISTLKNLGGYPVQLSSNTLRAETAAICAICKVMIS